LPSPNFFYPQNVIQNSKPHRKKRDWNHIRPNPSIGEILSFSNNLAGFYANFCTLTSNEEQKKGWSREILFIYRDILKDLRMRNEIKDVDREYNAAKKTLEGTKTHLEEVDLHSEVRNADEVLNNLNKLRSLIYGVSAMSNFRKELKRRSGVWNSASLRSLPSLCSGHNCLK